MQSGKSLLFSSFYYGNFRIPIRVLARKILSILAIYTTKNSLKNRQQSNMSIFFRLSYWIFNSNGLAAKKYTAYRSEKELSKKDTSLHAYNTLIFYFFRRLLKLVIKYYAKHLIYEKNRVDSTNKKIAWKVWVKVSFLATQNSCLNR